MPPPKTFAPESFRVLAPSLVKPPLEMTPSKITGAAISNDRPAPPRSTAPLKVNWPLSVRYPKPIVLPLLITRSFSKVRAALPVEVIADEEADAMFRVMGPVPSAESSPRRTG